MPNNNTIVLPENIPTLRWSDQFGEIWQNMGVSDLALRKALPNQCKRLAVPSEKGKGYWEFVEFDPEFGLFINNAEFNEKSVLSFHGEDLLKFHFRLQARSSIYIDPIGRVELDGAACQVFYHPKGVIDYEWIETGEIDSWVSIYCTPDYLFNVLGFDLDSLPVELANAMFAKTHRPFIKNFPMSLSLRQACADISRCEYSGALRSKYFEAQALQLLCETYAHLQSESADDQPALCERDIKAINEAYTILHENYKSPPNVETLSRTVGVNRTKLLAGFKSIYGMTLQDYCLHKRMESAKQLLKCSDQPISIIAESVGYDHPNNFSSAFKRVYGIPPSLARGKA